MVNDGGAAFPTTVHEGITSYEMGGWQIHSQTVGGMALRDYFATAALTAIINKCVPREQATGMTVPVTTEVQRLCARGAYAYADAMLLERAK